MTTVDHGFNLSAIRADLDREDWEENREDPGTEVRRLYLGSIFGLMPSGKMYTPFANNLDACETCKGTGHVIPRRIKRRTMKKQATRHAYAMRRFDALWGEVPATYSNGQDDRQPMPSLGRSWRPTNKRAAFAFIDRQPAAYRSRSFTHGAICTACGGCGSREAHLDEIWQEAAESAISSIEGVWLDWIDGDAFAVESRDAEDEQEVGQ
jgi:hypothetical protein